MGTVTRDWKTPNANGLGSISLNVRPHPKFQTECVLKMDQETVDHFKSEIDQVIADPNLEVKLDCPSGWTIYLKQRSGVSRIFLAKPQVGAWVGSIGLELEHAMAISSALDSEPQIAFSKKGVLNALSNLEISIEKI